MTKLASVNAHALLDAWERAQRAAPVVRPLLLLEAVTHEDAAALATLPLGARDRLLFELRQSALGARMACETHCPACSERIEFDVSVPALACETPSPREQSYEVEHEGWRIAFRLPNTADLIGSTENGDNTARRIALNCVQEARWGNAKVELDAVPDAALKASGRALRSTRSAGRYRARYRLPGMRSRLAQSLRHRRVSLARDRGMGRADAGRDPRHRLRLRLERGGHPESFAVAPALLPGATASVSYLDRLASRAADGPPSVAPRSFSRFEPVRVADEPTAPMPDAAAAESRPRISSRNAPDLVPPRDARSALLPTSGSVPPQVSRASNFPGLAEAHTLSTGMPPAFAAPATASLQAASAAERGDTPAQRAAISPAFEPPLAPGRSPGVVSSDPRSTPASGEGKSAPAAGSGAAGVRHVHVTIGRVEVRALAPAPAARQSAPARPPIALSLEDYLRKRGEP